MVTKARKYRVPKLKLRNEYEYTDIQRASTGATDNFGTPTLTWSTRSKEVKADIQDIKALSAAKLANFDQGMVAISSHWMMVEVGTDIKPRDRVVDIDSNSYEVKEVTDWRTHKEILLAIQERV